MRGRALGARRRLVLAGFLSVLAASGYVAAASSPASALVATTTTLTASPNPANAGATVTLTAATSAADGTHQAGSVQFAVGTTNIGSPVAVNASGVATTTTSFSASGQMALIALFTLTSTSYQFSQVTYTETVYPAGTTAAGSEPLTIAIPQEGAFTLTVAPGTVNLTVSGANATGVLQNVTVTDTRNYYPGWSVSGQESNFAGSGTAAGYTISGNQLGWTPTVVGSLQGSASLGGTVAPVSPGLGTTPATLASVPQGCGFGTNVLSANLTLAIPSTAAAGPYIGTMTITAVVTGPSGEICVPITVNF